MILKNLEKVERKTKTSTLKFTIEYSKMSWNVFEFSQIFRNILESSMHQLILKVLIQYII